MKCKQAYVKERGIPTNGQGKAGLLFSIYLAFPARTLTVYGEVPKHVLRFLHDEENLNMPTEIYSVCAF
jgi:hypothetical protein